MSEPVGQNQPKVQVQDITCPHAFGKGRGACGYVGVLPTQQDK